MAERKVRSLLKAGALVWVISPILTKGLEQLKSNKKIFYIKSDYKKQFLKDSFLVIAATDNKVINLKISRDAEAFCLLVNIVDSPNESNFIVPATLQRGDLIISISTSGRAPCFSKKIKGELSKLIIPQYARLLDVLKDVREELRLKCPEAKIRESILTCLVNSPRIAQLLRKRASKAKIREIIKKSLAELQ